MTETSPAPEYDKKEYLAFVLAEMDGYLDTPGSVLTKLHAPATEKNLSVITPLLFDAKALHARNLYEFFHNIRTKSKTGEKIFNEINILCRDYGYRSTANKKLFYQLKCEMDEKVIHLTIRREKNFGREKIWRQLDSFLLGDIRGFLCAIREEFGGYKADIDRLLQKCDEAEKF